MVTGVWQPIQKWQYVQYDIAVSVGLDLRGRLAAPSNRGEIASDNPLARFVVPRRIPVRIILADEKIFHMTGAI
jgi:hypothetical protein